MANEAVLKEPNAARLKSYSCSDANAIEQGALLVHGAGKTVTSHAGATESFAGVAEKEKDANDGQVSMTVYPPGCGAEFMFAASGTINAGDVLKLSGTANMVEAVNANTLSLTAIKSFVGKAVEAAASNQVRGVI